MEEKDSLATRISSLRNIKGISQRELARMTGIDNAEISRIEKGKRKKPGILILKNLSEVLNIDLRYLMKLSEYTQQEIDTFTKIEKSNEKNTPLNWGPIIKYSKVFENYRRIDIIELIRGFKKGSVSEYEFIQLLSEGFNIDLFKYIFEEKKPTISHEKNEK